MSWRSVAVCCLFVGALAAPERAFANGGTPQLTLEPAGPYELTVTTSPTTIRVGQADVSVLVYQASTGELFQDAQVTVTTEPLGHPGAPGRFPATHAQADNKLYYAANVQLPEAGRWRIGVQVESPLGEGATSFELEVSPPFLAGPRFLLLQLLLWLSLFRLWLRGHPIVVAVAAVALAAALLWQWRRSQQRPPPR